ncbi:MAG TPA: hypothetical protein VJG29_02090 [Candidatus Paceibacterota bacterium]
MEDTTQEKIIRPAHPRWQLTQFLRTWERRQVQTTVTDVFLAILLLTSAFFFAFVWGRYAELPMQHAFLGGLTAVFASAMLIIYGDKLDFTPGAIKSQYLMLLVFACGLISTMFGVTMFILGLITETP